MKRKSKFFVIFLYGLMTTASFAQKGTPFPLTVDLAKGVGKVITEHVLADQNLKVTIVNLIPNDKYEYNILMKIRAEPIHPLSLTRSAENIPAPHALARETCTDLQQACVSAYNAIINANEEAQVQKKIAELRRLMKRQQAQCPLPLQPTEEQVDSLIEKTQYIFDQPGYLRRGERLEVTVVRTEKESGEVPTWEHVFTTGPRGEWRTSYGFAFIPDLCKKEELYYTKTSEAGFVITRQENRKTIDLAAAVFFTWMPSAKENNTLYHGLTGGLGFDFENPVVLAGYSLTYNQNLTFHLGLIAHKQKQLLGKYKGGDPVAENLDDSQLHEELYRVNPYFALSFRFDKSPFGNKAAE